MSVAVVPGLFSWTGNKGVSQRVETGKLENKVGLAKGEAAPGQPQQTVAMQGCGSLLPDFLGFQEKCKIWVFV